MSSGTNKERLMQNNTKINNLIELLKTKTTDGDGSGNEELTEQNELLKSIILEREEEIRELRNSSVPITTASYFRITDGKITGLSSVAQTLYNNGELTELKLPDKYSLGDVVEVESQNTFADVFEFADYLQSSMENETLIYPFTITAEETSYEINNYDELAVCFDELQYTTGEIIVITKTIEQGIIDGEDYAITAINADAFKDYTNLKTVIFSNNILEIGDAAFYGCTALEYIGLQEGITTLGTNAFAYCDNLEVLYIPSTLTTFGTNVFFDSSGLKRVIVSPNNPKYDSRDVCNAIIETQTNKLFLGSAGTVIPNTVVVIGVDSFCRSTELTKIVIPEGVTKISASAFDICSNLTTISLPTTLEEIGYMAFRKCNLTTLTLPANIKEIGYAAFLSNNNLLTITILAQIPPTLGAASAIPNATTTIYIPKGTLAAYSTATNWSSFADKFVEQS